LNDVEKFGSVRVARERDEINEWGCVKQWVGCCCSWMLSTNNGWASRFTCQHSPCVCARAGVLCVQYIIDCPVGSRHTGRQQLFTGKPSYHKDDRAMPLWVPW